MMTPRDRVLHALRHEQPDYVPYELPIDAEVLVRLDEHYGGAEWRQRIKGHIGRFGMPDGRVMFEDGSGYRDAWGCVWYTKNIFHTSEVPLPAPTLDEYDVPHLLTDEVVEHAKKVAEDNAASPERRFIVAGSGMTFFERAWALRGMENILLDLVAEPDFANLLFDRLMEWHMPMIEAFGAIEGVDAIFFGDDFGAQRGLIMGTKWFREYLSPRLKIMYGRAHELGKHVYIHSCGDNSSIIEDLIELGVDIFNPFQPEAQDIYALKREYGKYITFEGGIGTQELLPFGTPKSITAEIRRLKQEIGKDGGFIISPTKPILPDVSTENAVACVEAVLEGTE
ncbi:MAG: uroporphyrinogen decarboxylase family protein [Armatimonadia bacterium]